MMIFIGAAQSPLSAVGEPGLSDDRKSDHQRSAHGQMSPHDQKSVRGNEANRVQTESAAFGRRKNQGHNTDNMGNRDTSNNNRDNRGRHTQAESGHHGHRVPGWSAIPE